MILSKARVVQSSKAAKAKLHDQGAAQRLRSLDELLEARDWAGAICLLTFRRQGAGRGDPKLAEWLAYAYFHDGQHDKALSLYQELLRSDDPDPAFHTYAAACLFYMGLTQQAVEQAQQGPRCPLATRILFHCAHKTGDEGGLMASHAQLGDSLEDQLSLAALHFNRGHHQEAADIYKALLLEHRELAALNVYVALCYAKLDYFDVSQDILQAYLSGQPTSPLALNLKACNTFRLANGRAAEAELKVLAEATGGKHTQHDLIRHNLVVFRGGEGAMQVLPGLGDVPAEAALNLAIHHLRRGEVAEADSLLAELQPSTPQEHILKAIVLVSLGQASGNAEQLKAAQQHFQLVGSSASEADTIPGRQAMASCFFLLRQYEDVLVFLNSIRSYFPADDDFAWNHGLALAAAGRHQEAADTLGSITSEKLRSDPMWVSWMARCLIATGRARAAWDLWQAAQASGAPAASGEGGAALLQLLAADSYKAGAFMTALQAYDALERLEPAPELFEAKRGAAVGVFQAVIAGKEQPHLLAEAVELLEASGAAAGGTSAVQARQTARVMRAWAMQHGIQA